MNQAREQRILLVLASGFLFLVLFPAAAAALVSRAEANRLHRGVIQAPAMASLRVMNGESALAIATIAEEITIHQQSNESEGEPETPPGMLRTVLRGSKEV